MRHKAFILLQIAILCTLLGSSAGYLSPKKSESNSEASDAKAKDLAGKFEDVLGIHGNKDRPDPQKFDQISRKDAVRYMQRLFTDHLKQHYFNTEDVITAIFPEKGERRKITFKPSLVDSNSIIDKAEVHIRPRHNADLRNSFIQVSCASCVKTKSLKVTPSSYDTHKWIKYDVTDLVDDALRNGKQSIEVEPKLRRAIYDIDVNQPWRSAFLTVETYNSSVVGKKDKMAENPKSRKHKIHKRSLDDYYRYMPTGDESDENSILGDVYGKADKSLEQLRSRDETIFRRNYNMVKTAGPRILQARPKPKKKYRSKIHRHDPMMGFGRDLSDETTTEITPHLSDFDSEFSVHLLDQENDTKNKHQRCQMRDRTVSFREIGWDKWIIAPKEFPADYCSGSCEFPLEPAHHATNHAQLQSILHTLAGTDIPDVCCAPQKLDSLSLLFYDENGNVVLKNFPKMVVSSCGCV
ncbi:unnamed protein product [Bursaphelenchus xylophilus]|uniref:(pine wood nematode) hypothetical protein n=1 Tax=Bursaphelenchus xylophilus TaxID=6326 RepID=A0A1I7RIZ5_BURXY|nr:unnamed protein product [Bursaphelenchus xylophilus]CAG9119192.1 unnamed protein product [Bursaphelenchus xylophilus]